jgi:hypothetical protein
LFLYSPRRRVDVAGEVDVADARAAPSVYPTRVRPISDSRARAEAALVPQRHREAVVAEAVRVVAEVAVELLPPRLRWQLRKKVAPRRPRRRVADGVV